MRGIKGKRVLITGSTSGIGEAAALRFAHEGASVIVVGRNKERGNLLVKNMEGEGHKFYCCDISDKDSIRNMVSEVIRTYDSIDALVNNAGIYPVECPIESDEENDTWETVFKTNVEGTFLLTKAFLKTVRDAKGTIINNASIVGMQAYAGGKSYAYASSKSAIIQFSRMLAKNYGAEIRVNCVCPGVVDTPIFTWGRENLSRFNSVIPMGRVGKPEEIASVICFLASDDASFINGCVIPIDGGQSL